MWTKLSTAINLVPRYSETALCYTMRYHKGAQTEKPGKMWKIHSNVQLQSYRGYKLTICQFSKKRLRSRVDK